jgi:23S rRNA (adenine2503-C2)-methyltransferase
MQPLMSIYGVTRPLLGLWLETSLRASEDRSTAQRRAAALFAALYRGVDRSFDRSVKGSVDCSVHPAEVPLVATEQSAAKTLPENVIRKEALESLQKSFSFQCPVEVREAHRSAADGSVKFAMATHDNLLVETVLIPERGRLTLCVSTQVGCAQGCRFCQTGRMGLLRSLRADEIVGQLVAVSRWMVENAVSSPEAIHKKDVASDESDANLKKRVPRISNVVFMGMGEPLDNLEALLNAIDIFVDEKGLGLSPNKVTVSTVGLLPQLETFLQKSGACLALSLHSPFDAERSRVMPVNAHHPLSEVLAVLRRHAQESGRRFMFQYTLIRNVNDSPAHAEALAALLEGLRAKVNLIPLNEHEGTAYRRPGLEPVFAFQSLLKARGLVATVRLSKGRDIQAACGQLIQQSGRRGHTVPSLAATLSPTR